MSEPSAASNDQTRDAGQVDEEFASREEVPPFAEELLSELSANLRGYLRGRLEDFDRTGEEYGRIIERLGDQTSVEIDRAVDCGKEYVREHPLRSVGGAFAVGLVLGWMTKRRK